MAGLAGLSSLSIQSGHNVNGNYKSFANKLSFLIISSFDVGKVIQNVKISRKSPSWIEREFNPAVIYSWSDPLINQMLSLWPGQDHYIQPAFCIETKMDSDKTVVFFDIIPASICKAVCGIVGNGLVEDLLLKKHIF